MDIKLRDYQQAAVDSLRQSYGTRHRAPLLVLPTGGGKCLGRGTPVMMADGSIKPVEQVAAGDLLMGPDSQPRTVVSTCTGQEQLYRVTPTKGEPYVVNESHILSLRITGMNGRVRGPDGKYYQSGDIANVTVKQYLAATKTFRHVAKGWRAPVRSFIGSRDMPIPPYILGVWLGDGSSNGAAICNVDKEVTDSWRDYAESIGHRVCVRDERRAPVHFIIGPEDCAIGRGHHRNQVLNSLRQIGVLNNKHIPISYRTASWDDRLQLLAGIVDTDGYLKRCGYDIVLKQRELAEGVCFVARSLGLAAYMKPCKKTCTNTGAVGDYCSPHVRG